MRVIAGSLGGRSFGAPKGHRTHPMSDKMRGALFSKLGDIDGLRVLDAFAGSGALGIEAASRGALLVVCLEVDRSAHTTIVENAQQLGIGNLKAVRASVGGWSDNNSDAKFDLVLADPPYDQPHIAQIQKLTQHVVPDGILVLSWPGKVQSPTLDNMHQVDQSSYGDGQLVFYRRIS